MIKCCFNCNNSEVLEINTTNNNTNNTTNNTTNNNTNNTTDITLLAYTCRFSASHRAILDPFVDRSIICGEFKKKQKLIKET